MPFSGQCRAHRAELYLLHGEWEAALTAALAAQEQLRRGDRHALFGAYYQQGEVQRLRGEFEAAEESYRRANESGFDPQPGPRAASARAGKAPAGADPHPPGQPTTPTPPPAGDDSRPWSRSSWLQMMSSQPDAARTS